MTIACGVTQGLSQGNHGIDAGGAQLPPQDEGGYLLSIEIQPALPHIRPMETLIATNNIVTISFTEAVLKDAQIDYYMADMHTSIIEGSIGVIPKRVMVLGEDLEAARRALSLAGLEDELPKI